MRAAEHMEHGLCFFHRIYANPVVMSINNSWDIDSVSFMGKHAPHVVMRIEQSLENGLYKYWRRSLAVCCHGIYDTYTKTGATSLFFSNYAAPVVMKVEQQLAHILHYFYGKHAPPTFARDEEQLLLGIY